jgi:uncharacterized protein YyaL (SSP411 family)
MNLQEYVMKIKIINLIYVMLAIVTIALFLPLETSASDSIKWYSYNEGMHAGRTEKKAVFLHFYADWCGYCRKMAKESFQDPIIISYLNENFISIRVNYDKEGDIATYYGIRAVPSTWILAPTGESINTITGYMRPQALLSMLNEAQ